METKEFLAKILSGQEVRPVVVENGKCVMVCNLDEDYLQSKVSNLSTTSKHLLRLRVSRMKKDADYLFQHTQVGKNVTETEYEKRKQITLFWENAIEVCAKYW